MFTTTDLATGRYTSPSASCVSTDSTAIKPIDMSVFDATAELSKAISTTKKVIKIHSKRSDLIITYLFSRS